MAAGPDLDLDLNDSPRFEDNWAKVKAVLIVVLALFVAGGLAGVFGRGPLSRASAQLPASGAQVSWERFARNHTAGEISVEFTSPGPSPAAEIAFDRPLLDHVKITTTQPRAAIERANGAGAVYGFQMGPGGRGKVVFSVEPSKSGPADGAITVNGERLPLNIFVWP